MGVTKYILKHPVTTVMALLCLVVFGISSVFSAKLEQMPDMETPMLIIMANYSGAGPEDISALVTEPRRRSARWKAWTRFPPHRAMDVR